MTDLYGFMTDLYGFMTDHHGFMTDLHGFMTDLCCKTRLATFVLRGCDSISLVPYVSGPILATICRSESQLTRVSSSTC